MSKDTGFTPGPWTFIPPSTVRDLCRVHSAETTVCNVYRGLNDIANANLIAAAPEMLKVLERLQEATGSEYIGDDGRAAIAKARGETPHNLSI